MRDGVAAALRQEYPDFEMKELDELLGLLWANNESYVRISPPRLVASMVRLLQRGNRSGGLSLDVEELTGTESGVFFAVANPPDPNFLVQVVEVLNRLGLGTARAHCLNISNGVHPYFLGAFYVYPRNGGRLKAGSALHTQLERELFKVPQPVPGDVLRETCADAGSRDHVLHLRMRAVCAVAGRPTMVRIKEWKRFGTTGWEYDIRGIRPDGTRYRERRKSSSSSPTSACSQASSP